MHFPRWAMAPLLLAVLCLAPACARAQRSNTSFSTLPNDTSVGTTLNFLAKKVPGGAGGKAKLVVATATDTTIPLYVVNSNAGIAGSAVYILSGEGPCVFDTTGTVCGKGGTSVVVGTGGRCHQTDTPPSPGMVVGTLNDDCTTNGQTSQVDFNNTQYSAPPGAGSGTVTSVGITVPAEFAVAPATITTSGVFAITKASVSPNCVLAGPASGGPAAWSCRLLVAADVASLSIPVSGTAGGDLSGTYPNPSVVKASAQFDYSGILTTSLSGPVNDWSPTGPPNFPVATIVRVTATTATVRITGLAAQNNGNIKNICNYGAVNPIVLGNQDTASAAANRLSLAPLNLATGFADDITLPPGQCKALWYDGSNQRWYAWDGTPEDYLKLRPFSLFVGDPDASSPVLLAGNDSPTVWTNLYRRPLKLLSFSCKILPSGTLAVLPILTGQSATSVLSAACTCGVGSFTNTCALNGTPILQPASGAGATCAAPPCSLDFNIDSTDSNAKVVIGNFEAILQ